MAGVFKGRFMKYLTYIFVLYTTALMGKICKINLFFCSFTLNTPIHYHTQYNYSTISSPVPACNLVFS